MYHKTKFSTKYYLLLQNKPSLPPQEIAAKLIPNFELENRILIQLPIRGDFEQSTLSSLSSLILAQVVKVQKIYRLKVQVLQIPKFSF